MRRKSELHPTYAMDQAKLTFRRWLKSRHTTGDVVSNLSDLKVLGKGDFKMLMKWRLALRLEIGLDVKAELEKDVTEDVTIEPMDEEEEISEEVR